jgi:hypothetical protein
VRCSNLLPIVMSKSIRDSELVLSAAVLDKLGIDKNDHTPLVWYSAI